MWWRKEVFSLDHNLPWNVPPWKISPRLPWRWPGRSLLLPWAGSVVRAGSLQPPHCRGQPWTHPRQCAVCRVCVTCGVCMVCGVWCDMKVLVHCQSASGQVAAAAGPVAPAAAPPRTTATTTWHQPTSCATSYLTMLLSLGIGRSQIKLSFTINISKFSGMDMATYHN